MIKKFIPKAYYKDVFQINYSRLKENGIKLLIFDLDNTLSLIDEKVPSKEVIDLINKISCDFNILIASNNTSKRVKKYCEKLNCKYISSSLKPLKKIAYFVKKKYNLLFNEVSIIGDQLVTDIFVGNRCGMYTILVDPKGNKDLKVTSVNRFIEDKIKKRINFKKGVYYEEN